MKQKKISRPWLAPTIILAIFLIALFSVNHFASTFAQQKLESAINKSEHYKIYLESFHVNVFTGCASAINIRISPSSSSNDSIEGVNFLAASIKLSGISWYSLVFKKIICIGGIQMQQPEISVKNWEVARKKNTAKKNFTLYDLIHTKFQSLRINKLEFNDGRISMSGKDSSNFFLASDSVNLELHDLLTDSATSHAEKFLAISSAVVSLKNIHGNFSEGFYRITIPSFTFSTSNGEASIDSMNFFPTIDKTLFAKKLGYQVAVRDIMMARVKVHSKEFLNLIELRQVLIDSVEIGYARIYNYKDRNIPGKFARHVLHHTFLDSLPFKLDLEKVKVDDGNVIYESLNIGATEPGRIDFDNITFSLTKFSNVNMRDTMRVDMSCKAMSHADFNLHMELPLAKNEFYANGTIGTHDMSIWNPILKNYSPSIQINSGHATKSTFSFSADSTAGTGSMTFMYSDLHVHVLNSDYEKGRGMSKLKTMIANKMIVIKNNPDDNRLRIGKIQYKRNPERNFISYAYHLIFSGMESSVGLKKEKLNQEISKY